MAKILVTGGAGFIGSHTCLELLKRNYKVSIIDSFINSSPIALKRVEEILTKKEVSINNQNQIIWKENAVARLKKGNDYLNPEIEIIADDSLNEESKMKLLKFLIVVIVFILNVF